MICRVFKFKILFTGQDVSLIIIKREQWNRVYEAIKNKKLNVVVFKKTPKQVKHIYTFSTYSQIKIDGDEILKFNFPRKFYTYFKSTEPDYFISFYPNQVLPNEYFSLISYFQKKEVCYPNISSVSML